MKNLNKRLKHLDVYYNARSSLINEAITTGQKFRYNFAYY